MAQKLIKHWPFALVSLMVKNDEWSSSILFSFCSIFEVGLHMNTVGGNNLILVSPGQFRYKYVHALFYIYD